MSYIKIKHNTERSFITLNTTFAEHYKLIVEIEPVFDSEIILLKRLKIIRGMSI